jgi:hypothetical protein
MPVGGPDDVLTRYRRSMDACEQVEATQLAVRDAAARRLSEEARLASLHRELERFTGWNLATWWPRLTGRIRDRQAALTSAIVQQEPITRRAVMAHEQALQRSAEIAALVDQLPAAREAAALSLTGAAGEQARALLAEQDEVRADLEITGRAQLLAMQTTRELGRAEGWSALDTWGGGGWVSTAIKHEHVDDANESAATLTDLLTRLRPQLQALGAPTSYFSVDASNRTADLWFDNIVSDFASGSRIKESANRVDQLHVGLARLAETMGERHRALVKQLDSLIAASTSADPAD